MNPFWRQGIVLLIPLSCGSWLSAQDPIPVQSRVFDIEYKVNASATPLESVSLWYTSDGGLSWHHYGFDEDRQSPMAFNAPSEGLLGFLFVMKNSAGQSSAAPSAGTRPHLRAFVDFTPPVVQLHPPRQTSALGQRVLQIRWAAIDANLPSRAVEIEYQQPPEQPWHLVTPEPVANSGRYDWRIKPELRGRVALRVRVRDRGGHVATSEPQVTELTDVAPIGLAAADREGTTDTTAVSASKRARAQEYFLKGKAHDAEGRVRAGIGQMREAVRLDPNRTDAFAAMAGMLYRIKDFDRALEAYELVLKQEPEHRGALQGVAMVLRQKNDYGGAATRLRALLRTNPDDAEIWMNLGDVAIFQGDEITARESYQRAIESQAAAPAIIEDAKQRLNLMSQVSRSYR